MDISRLGRVGVWAREDGLSPDLGVRLEALGYGTIWIGGSPGGDLSVAIGLLAATDSIVVATGIVNMWADDAVDIAAAQRRIAAAFPGRFLLGVGIGHPERTREYHSPYRTMVEYLDVLDDQDVPVDDRVLAALGPKALRLAADRSLGAHPYLTTPAHTRTARTELGPGVLLAPEQTVAVEPDPSAARSLARGMLGYYFGLTNYVANLRREGWSDADLADGGRDEVVDALVAHGDAMAVAARIGEQLDAGADHVAVQVLAHDTEHATRSYAELAEALHLRS